MGRPPRERDKYLASNGYYYAYISRTERVSLKTKDPEQATIRLAELLQQPRSTSVKEAKDITISNLTALAYRNSLQRNSKQTAETFLTKMTNVVRYLEGKGVIYPRQLTQKAIKDWLSSRLNNRDRIKSEDPEARGVSKASINTDLVCIVKALKEGKEQGVDCSEQIKLVKAEWFKGIDSRKTNARLSTQEILQFLNAAPHPYKALFRFALGSGLRFSELTHISLDDLSDDTITVTPKAGWSTKNHRYRTIRATATTIEAAKQFIANRSQMKLDPKSVWKVIQASCEAAGIKGFSIHWLRHTCASHWLDAGVKLIHISKMLGHSEIGTTMKYLGIVEDLPEVDELRW